MKKTTLMALFIAILMASCGASKSAAFLKPVKHGGPCPQNSGMIGYSRF